MSTNLNSIEHLDTSIEDTHKRLHELRVKSKRLYLVNIEHRQKISSHIESLTSRIRKLLEEEPQKRSSLQPYLFAVRKVMAGDTPQYVQTIQAKLCQSLHFLGIGEAQLRKMRYHNKREAASAKAESVVLTDESTSLTMDLVNKISCQDDHNHSLRFAYLEVMKSQSAIIRMLDLQTQPSIGSINVPISSGDDEDAYIRLDLTKRSSSKSAGVFIKSGDLAKHYMEQFQASLEFSDSNNLNFNDSNSSLYISPVSVIPLRKLDSHQTADITFPAPSLITL
mmetsp:Transcript_10888/g.18049  ORF Transcript_10888/g.18049 Transcript_10888/m.18049 type:complete len:280 (+) Transcript_10888:161-1000(+)|eukprot:CAMPEP_0119003014 /NCGR_PEP_ID=MMETSP1176-20130426/301_1 /TAXON_ID=265551 /ORGANISM="Synedropsis recta cf, Strain CCMP1620" /LENGTH=279 /DNA_ID=CAMNT_0006954569 /DNA_START=146 /DNA_END=985 /DNA_ORIENTATION=+